MMKIKKSKIIIITMLLLFFAIAIMPMKVFATTEINKVEFSMKDYYNAGDKPEASAHGYGETKDYYEVDYEYWREEETNKLWKSNKSENELTTFEEGKTYSYGIYLKAKEGYTFADNKEVYVNDEKVGLVTLDDTKTRMMLLAIKKITPTVYQEKYIEEVEINNATVSFKAGDKPVFTGKVSDDAPYSLRDESWETDGGNKGHHLGSMWNENNKDKLFSTFEGGKTYNYGVYFVSNDFQGYFFTRDTKLKINGKYYNYSSLDWESQPDVNKFATMWVTTDLIMTPKSEKLVDLIEITDVTTKFNVGDAPKFTGKVADNALYEIDYEGWSGDNEIITTSEYWNNRFKDWGNAPLTSFKANTEYSYTIYVKLTDEAVKDGYYFDKDKTKLSINGEFINIDSKYVGIDEGNPTVATFGEVLKMTPIENSQGNPTTPSEPEKPSQETEKEPQTTENKTEQTKNETNNPKTGDNITTSIMLFVASIATIGTLTIVKRKKSRE